MVPSHSDLWARFGPFFSKESKHCQNSADLVHVGFSWLITISKNQVKTCQTELQGVERCPATAVQQCNQVCILWTNTLSTNSSSTHPPTCTSTKLILPSQVQLDAARCRFTWCRRGANSPSLEIEKAASSLLDCGHSSTYIIIQMIQYQIKFKV